MQLATPTQKPTKNLKLPLLIFLIAAVAVAVFCLVTRANSDSNSAEESTEPTSAETTETEEAEAEPAPVSLDLQSVAEDWLAPLSGTASIIFYDPLTSETVASINPTASYPTESLYKLFVVYAGYLETQADTSLDANLNPTGLANFSLADPLANGYTYGECLDLAIRESNSSCAESIWSLLGHEWLDTVVANWGFTETSVSGLTSSASDMLKIIQKYYAHTDLTAENWELIADSFLNQPVTTADWRRGFPAGFTSSVDVYNKVGWYRETVQQTWFRYHDVGWLHDQASGRDLLYVVMTKDIDNADIANLGRAVEAVLRAQL